jgi:hypothetical protein
VALSVSIALPNGTSKAARPPSGGHAAARMGQHCGQARQAIWITHPSKGNSSIQKPTVSCKFDPVMAADMRGSYYSGRLHRTLATRLHRILCCNPFRSESCLSSLPGTWVPISRRFCNNFRTRISHANNSVKSSLASPNSNDCFERGQCINRTK